MNADTILALEHSVANAKELLEAARAVVRDREHDLSRFEKALYRARHDSGGAERAFETIRDAFPGSMGGYGPWDTLDERTRGRIFKAWEKHR